MKMRNIISSVLATSVMASAMSISAYAEAETVTIAPVYPYFDTHDINGSVVVNLPENTALDLEITMDSNEEPGIVYHDSELSSAEGSSFAFEIEGRDNTEEDYRRYNLRFNVKDEVQNLVSESFTREFTVPDGVLNPNTWTEFRYNVSIEILDTEVPFAEQTTTFSENGISVVETNVVFYVDYLLGDVNSDLKVTTVDAALVLSEYAALAIEEPSTFTEKQTIAADVNGDGKITPTDAAKILAYYSDMQTNGSASWE